MIHIFRVQDGPTRHDRQWWICDDRGERLVKSTQSKQTAIMIWAQRHEDPATLTKRIQYKGIARASEAAMAIADLRMRSHDKVPD